MYKNSALPTSALVQTSLSTVQSTCAILMVGLSFTAAASSPHVGARRLQCPADATGKGQGIVLTTLHGLVQKAFTGSRRAGVALQSVAQPLLLHAMCNCAQRLVGGRRSGACTANCGPTTRLTATAPCTAACWCQAACMDGIDCLLTKPDALTTPWRKELQAGGAHAEEQSRVSCDLSGCFITNPSKTSVHASLCAP
jgi:hypothetical protein